MVENRMISGIRLTLAVNALALACATLAGAPPAQADDSKTDGIEEVVVTGSRIARDEFSSPAPISVFDEREIINSGVVTVDEFLKEVPSFTGFQYGVSTNNGNIGLKAVNLRGLGAKRTLTLINGRRQVGSFIGGNSDVGAVDLNTIPHAMIERVEVLKDGASTIYGSDALSGVVNVILKEDFEGVELRGTYGAGTTGWDAGNYGFSATLGRAGKRGRVVIGAEYSNQDELLQAGRDWALYDLHPRLIDGRFVGVPSGSSNSRRIHSAEFDAAGNAALAAAGFDPGQQFIVDAGTGQPRPFTAADAYNYAPVNALITPNERYQLSAIGSFAVNDNLAVFVEAFYTRRASHQRLAPDASFAINDNVETPNNGVQWNDFVPAANPANPFGDSPNNPYGISGQDVRINRRFEETGGRLFNQSVDTWRIVVGLEGAIGEGLSWEAYYARAENKDTQSAFNSGRFDRWAILVDPSACGAIPDCVTATGGAGYLDPFQEFGSIPLSVFDYLTADALKDLRRNDMEIWSVNLSGDLSGRVSLSGGSPAWAVGYERRAESARYAPDEFKGKGLTTSGAASPLAGGFNVDELYAEAYLPFRADLSVDASVRYSYYNTAGDTTNFRIGANWIPVDQLALRARYSTGFRAPNVVELFSGDQTDFPLLDDPCEFFDRRPDPDGALAANCAANGFPPGFEWGFAWQAVYTATAPPPGTLEPEESTTYSVGAVWGPQFLPGLSLSIDYWNIEVDDFIDVPPYNSLLRACLYAVDQATELACGFFTGGTGHDNGIPAGANVPLVNLGLVKTDGIDFNFSYNRGWDFWLFHGFGFALASTLLLSYEEVFPATGNIDRAGFIQNFQAYPEWKTTASLTLQASNWSMTWGARYISSMDDFLRPANLTHDPTAEAAWSNDVFVNYNISDLITLTIGLDNIFDEAPPSFHSAFNAETDPGTYDTIGRRFFAAFTTRF